MASLPTARMAVMIDEHLHSIQYGNTVIIYRVKRSTTLHGNVLIHVEPDGAVIVEIPDDCDDGRIRSAVRARARWIHSHLQEIVARKKHVLEREYVSGESHPYLGRRYILKVLRSTAANPVGVKLVGSYLKVWIDRKSDRAQDELVCELLKNWYRDHAIRHIERRLTSLCAAIPWQKTAPPWQLRRMKKQWGSCSPLKRITINPDIIKAPSQCVDYVLMHELCHLREHNHSAKFYRLLERYCPKWENAKYKLEQLAEQLLLV